MENEAFVSFRPTLPKGGYFGLKFLKTGFGFESSTLKLGCTNFHENQTFFIFGPNMPPIKLVKVEILKI